MNKSVLIFRRSRIGKFLCLTVTGLTYLVWQLVALDGKYLKVPNRSSQIFLEDAQREEIYFAVSNIQEILSNSSGYVDIFLRDPDVSCKYPLLNPLDEFSIRNYQKKTIRCDNLNDDRAVIDLTGGLTLKPDMRGRNEYCFYSEITRPLLEERADFSLKAPLVGTIYPQSDFTYIECLNESGNITFTDLLARTQRIQDIREYNNSDEFSIAVIGVGSMTRMNFMRQMPRSYNFLKNSMGSIEMQGFSVVETATSYQNIVAMVERKEGSGNSSKFIWEDFEEAGAVTMYAEDAPKMEMFRRGAKPLKRKPTHHYGNTFWAALRNSGKAHRSQENCFGFHPRHLLHLKYILSFLRTYKDSPSFLLSLYNELTRENVNLAQGMDDDFAEFLRTLVKEELLSRTVVMIVGVHDELFDKPTRPQSTEDKMQLVSVILPQSTPQRWKDALQVNRKRMTSTYDLYKTLIDILGTLNVSKTKINRLKDMNPGTSLFAEISPNRTCQDASLGVEWCLCQEN
ncbi:hypothetical protein GE061_010122 [Apolygus lucorum]|uniref:Uncharacterized protein n=1 Tax=Apolygus lucorum TaxID=248454 RepID=A0A6A4J0R4_APOLU|nr:hypothetical protein GE061_010122 [Apolygus lucorum]